MRTDTLGLGRSVPLRWVVQRGEPLVYLLGVVPPKRNELSRLPLGAKLVGAAGISVIAMLQQFRPGVN